MSVEKDLFHTFNESNLFMLLSMRDKFHFLVKFLTTDVTLELLPIIIVQTKMSFQVIFSIEHFFTNRTWKLWKMSSSVMSHLAFSYLFGTNITGHFIARRWQLNSFMILHVFLKVNFQNHSWTSATVLLLIFGRMGQMISLHMFLHQW